jgi:peptidoglycan-associated lipoprotein
LRSFDGFTLLLWLSIAIMLFWAAFIVLRVRGVGLSAGTGGGTKVGSQVQNPPKPNLRQRFADLKDAYFDLESNDVRGDARAALTSNAELLKKIFGEFPDAVAVIEGHADDRGTRENNFGLGYRRATAAKEFLLQLGLPPAKLNTITLGKEKPQCVESNEECLARNRRVHFSP